MKKLNQYGLQTSPSALRVVISLLNLSALSSFTCAGFLPNKVANDFPGSLTSSFSNSFCLDRTTSV